MAKGGFSSEGPCGLFGRTGDTEDRMVGVPRRYKLAGGG